MADIQNIQKKASSNGAGLVSSAATSDQALGQINRDLEEKAAQERAVELKLPYVDIGMFPINPDVLHLVKEEDARKASLMPFFKAGKKVRIAVTDPKKAETEALFQNLKSMGYELQIHLASSISLNEAFRHYESAQYKLKTETKNIVAEQEIKYEKELENLAALKDRIAALPSEEALNTLHVSAIKAGASDIHYQPEENECVIRFRIDGVLHNVFSVGKDVYANLANQLKYKAGMKLNITTVPQDGRFRFIVNERKIDVRVSSIPTEYGESFVCRILDSGKHFGNFDELGFTGKSLEILKKSCELAQGMVLVTGPTSSGKTTTLYVLLNKFNQPEVKIITLEDPIEYHLQGITQSQINEKRGYNFADGLRSILRQDPDVVMIGEIRDLETAEACAQAALTGHVVLSTLHTNSAVETIPRLVTIGLPPFMVAPSLSVVIAQRLVRRICDACKKERPVTDKEKEVFEKTLQAIKTVDPTVSVSVPATVKVQQGCEACSVTGFRGQMIVSEVLYVDSEVKDAILANKSANDILALARKKGMLTMYEDGILKVIAGHTTLDELHRVINM